MKVKIILTIFIFLLGSLSQRKMNIEPIKLDDRYTERNTEDINHENLYSAIKNSHIKFPRIAFVQAVIESGNFTSPLFRSHNNLFGMRFPLVRETSSVGKSKKGYAIYEDWSDSVHDYLLWQKYFTKGKKMSEEEYLDLLGGIYAEDVSYVSAIKRGIKKFNHIF